MGGKINEEVVFICSSFFFSEFPDKVSDKEMFEIFGFIRDIMEVVIPRKRNKFGKQLGLRYFLMWRMIGCLRLIWIKLLLMAIRFMKKN